MKEEYSHNCSLATTPDRQTSNYIPGSTPVIAAAINNTANATTTATTTATSNNNNNTSATALNEDYLIQCLSTDEPRPPSPTRYSSERTTLEQLYAMNKLINQQEFMKHQDILIALESSNENSIRSSYDDTHTSSTSNSSNNLATNNNGHDNDDTTNSNSFRNSNDENDSNYLLSQLNLYNSRRSPSSHKKSNNNNNNNNNSSHHKVTMKTSNNNNYNDNHTNLQNSIDNEDEGIKVDRTSLNRRRASIKSPLSITQPFWDFVSSLKTLPSHLSSPSSLPSVSLSAGSTSSARVSPKVTPRGKSTTLGMNFNTNSSHHSQNSNRSSSNRKSPFYGEKHDYDAEADEESTQHLLDCTSLVVSDLLTEAQAENIEITSKLNVQSPDTKSILKAISHKNVSFCQNLE